MNMQQYKIEKLTLEQHLKTLSELERFIDTITDEDHADDAKRALSDAYDNATHRWAKLADAKDVEKDLLRTWHAAGMRWQKFEVPIADGKGDTDFQSAEAAIRIDLAAQAADSRTEPMR